MKSNGWNIIVLRMSIKFLLQCICLYSKIKQFIFEKWIELEKDERKINIKRYNT